MSAPGWLLRVASCSSAPSERRADRRHEDLVVRPGVEPEGADRDAPPGQLHERPALEVALAAIGAGALRDEPEAQRLSGRRASPAEKPSWEFAITAYPTRVRGGENYTSAIGVADRGPLHLEARYNYESIGARSAYVGWTFSGGTRSRGR